MESVAFAYVLTYKVTPRNVKRGDPVANFRAIVVVSYSWDFYRKSLRSCELLRNERAFPARSICLHREKTLAAFACAVVVNLLLVPVGWRPIMYDQ